MDEFSARATARAARRRRPGTTTARSCRSTTRRASSTPPTTACARTRPPRTSPSCKPFFDRKYGNVTAGNSSQITDGARVAGARLRAAVEQARLHAARAASSTPQWAGLDPAQMGLGPVHAATPILQRHGLGLDDLDAWEINEAFAAQVIACLARVGGRRLLPRPSSACPARWARSTARKLNVDGGADRARPSGRRVGRAHRAARARTCCAAPAAGAAWRRSASAAAWAARCWSSAPESITARHAICHVTERTR